MPTPDPQAVDLLIEARWVLPIAPAARALADHAVAVREGRIVALGPTAELDARFAPRERVRRAAHVLLPGFVNAHTEAALTVLRACSPAGAAHDAIADTFPEEQLLTPDLARAGAQLALAEMLRAGITSFASRDAYPQETARLASALRMRAAIGLPVSEQAAGRANGATAYLGRAEQIWDEYRSDPAVCLYFAPDAPLALRDATLAHVRTVADELDARIALPLHRSVAEIAAARARFGRRPLERLHALGLLRPGFVGLHMNHLDAADLELIERTGMAVVACARAALRLAHASPPLAALSEAGVPLGLGSGSPLTVFVPDLLGEARAAVWALAAQRARGSGDAAGHDAAPDRDDAARALELATLGSARALGLAAKVGSIETGKAADLIAIDLQALGPLHATTLAEAVLFGATRDRVSDVWIGGRAAVSSGQLLALDEEELLAAARQLAAHLPTVGFAWQARHAAPEG